MTGRDCAGKESRSAIRKRSPFRDCKRTPTVEPMEGTPPPSGVPMKESHERILRAIRARTEGTGMPEGTLQALVRAVRQLLEGHSPWIREQDLEPVGPLPHARDLPGSPGAPIDELAVIKLNGGLGTSMGLSGPKSLLPVRGSLNFLDIIARQILGIRRRGGAPRFLLMNSWRTREPSLRHLAAHRGLFPGEGAADFLQGRIPRLRCDTLMPVEWERDPALEWCPPGHGDIYFALQAGGLLDELIESGVGYLFVSNADNLGATVDTALLDHFARSGAGFMMEVAERTRADGKGGHLARRRSDSRLVLRELAQCAPEDRERFRNPGLHGWFNTNNLWIRTRALRSLLDSGGPRLPAMHNRKRTDSAVPDSPEVWQLESAMGAAIECFADSRAIAVSRDRFAPVKTTADLLAVRSDAYTLAGDHRPELSPHRRGIPPVIRLDPDHFGRLPDFERRLDRGTPSLADCEVLEVQGDLLFDAGVVCRGSVTFRNRGSGPVRIPPGDYIDRTVVFS